MMSVLSRIAAVVSVCVLSVALPAPALAQKPAGLGEISAGYMFMRDTSYTVSASGKANFPVGWYVSAGGNPTEWFGVIGEVGISHLNDLESTFTPGQTYSADAQVYTALGGPRVFHKVGRVAPFAQVLAGVAHTRVNTTRPAQFGYESGTSTRTTTDFAVQPGGGVTVYLTDHVGIRVAGDYRSIIDFQDEGNGYTNQFRFVAGFTWEWGDR